jgi:uncharacterized membrane protein YoaT (DUF817 family)
MGKRRATAALYEFVRFGMKQAWACLFGGLMVFLLIVTHFYYPRGAALARYDFLFLAALSLQALLLTLRLETFEEAKVIFAYHVVGTAMELFKTSAACRCFPASCIPASAATCAAPGRCFTLSSRRTRRCPGSSP